IYEWLRGDYPPVGGKCNPFFMLKGRNLRRKWPEGRRRASASRRKSSASRRQGVASRRQGVASRRKGVATGGKGVAGGKRASQVEGWASQSRPWVLFKIATRRGAGGGMWLQIVQLQIFWLQTVQGAQPLIHVA